MTANPPSASPKLLSADEFASLYSRHRVELVGGTFKTLPMSGAQPGKVCMTVGWLIGNYVAENDIGHVMGNDTFILTGSNPDSVRGADVLFIPYDRLPRDEVPPGVLRMTIIHMHVRNRGRLGVASRADRLGEEGRGRTE